MGLGWSRRTLVAAALAAATIAVTLLLTKPISPLRQHVEIGISDISDEGRRFNVNTDTCLQDVAVTVVEDSSSRVRLRATADRRFFGGPTCAEYAKIRLTRPLDRRPVIDDATGKPIQIDRGD